MRLRKKTYLTPYQLFEKSLRQSEPDTYPTVSTRPVAQAGNVDPESMEDAYMRSRSAGLTSAAMPSKEPTEDDLSPETLIKEDGERPANIPFDDDSVRAGQSERFRQSEDAADHPINEDQDLLEEAARIDAYKQAGKSPQGRRPLGR